MELREWLIILGLVLVTIIIVDGVRRLQRQRRGLRLDISRDIDPDDPPRDQDDIRREEQVSWELPNGGARVVRPDRHEHDDEPPVAAGSNSRHQVDEEVDLTDRRAPDWQEHNRRMEERWQRRGEAAGPEFEADESFARDHDDDEADDWPFNDELRGPRLAASRDDDRLDPLEDPDSPPLTRDTRAQRDERWQAFDDSDASSHPHDEALEDEEAYDEPPRRRPLSGLRDWAQSQIDALDQKRSEQTQRREATARQREEAKKEKSAERRQAPASAARKGAPEHERVRDLPPQDDQPAMRESPPRPPSYADEEDHLSSHEMSDDFADEAFESSRGIARHPAVERARRHHVSAGRARNALSDAEEIIVISVNSRDEEGFNRPDLLQLVLACGLRYCEEMGVFHRFETEAADSGLQFSMINSLKPGTFDLDDMDDGTLPSVTFLMPLPGAEDAPMAFEAMVETAMVLVRNLGGELKDENRSVMTAQTIEFARQRVRDFERRWRLHRQAH